MIPQPEKAELIRRANGLIGILSSDEERVGEITQMLFEAPTRLRWTNPGNYYQKKLERSQEENFEIAILGKLDTIADSLAERFKIEDRISMAMGIEPPSVERRLDLCILAATSRAARLLMMHDQEGKKKKNNVQIRKEPAMFTASFDFRRDPLLDLEESRFLQRFIIEGGSQQAMDVIINPAVKRFKDRQLNQQKRNSPQEEDGSRISEAQRLGMSEDDTYSYFLNEMISSAKEGLVCGNHFQRFENVLWLFDKQGFVPPPELTSRLVAYAFMNKAKLQISEVLYKEDKNQLKSAKNADLAISDLTKATGFMKARISFLIDWDRITFNFEDVLREVLGKTNKDLQMDEIS